LAEDLTRFQLRTTWSSMHEHCDWRARPAMPAASPTLRVSDAVLSHRAMPCRPSGCTDGVQEHKLFPSPAPSSVYPADISTAVGTAIDSSSDAGMSECDHLDWAECTHTAEIAHVPECQPIHYMEHRESPQPWSNHTNAYRALLEHYGLLGAPSGFWSRRDQSVDQGCDMHLTLNPHPDTASNLADEEDLDEYSDLNDSGDDSSTYEDSHELSMNRVAVDSALNEHHLFESASRHCPAHEESPTAQKGKFLSDKVDADCAVMTPQPCSAFSGVLAADDTSMISISDDAYQFGTECTDDRDRFLGTHPSSDPQVDLAAWQTVGARLSRVLDNFADSETDTNLPKSSIWEQCRCMDSLATPPATNSVQLSAKAGRQVQDRPSVCACCPSGEPMNSSRWQEVGKRIGEVLAYGVESDSDCEPSC